MITTSKYEENGFADIITGLVKVYDPKIVVELGTQRGASAIIIGKALKDGILWTYDLFQEAYPLPPYSRTYADREEAEYYIGAQGLLGKVRVRIGDAFQIHKEFDEVDILHIDLCNHYDNIATILPHWRYKVKKVIILEGGGYNKWQRELGFSPFTPLLKRHFVTDNYWVSIITKNEDYALTILIRKTHDTNVQS